MLGGGEEELQGAHLFLHGLGAHHGLEEDHLVPLEGAHHLHPGHSHARLDLRLVGASHHRHKHHKHQHQNCSSRMTQRMVKFCC